VRALLLLATTAAMANEKATPDAPGLERYAEPLSRLATVASCSERLWPQFTLRGIEILFFEETSTTWRRARFDDNGRLLTGAPLPETESMNWIQPKVEYRLIDTEAGKILALRLGLRVLRRPSRMVEVFVHEIFHIHTLLSNHIPWTSNGSWRRGQGQLEKKPVVEARQRLIDTIISGLQSGDPDIPRLAQLARALEQLDLDRAANFWKLDRAEGAAEYVGRKAIALSELGCSSGPTQLTRLALQRMREDVYRRYLIKDRVEVDADSYLIGAYVGLLLDMSGHAQEWPSKVMAGKSFVELLSELSLRKD
jgi:hypothetical protein